VHVPPLDQVHGCVEATVVASTTWKPLLAAVNPPAMLYMTPFWAWYVAGVTPTVVANDPTENREIANKGSSILSGSPSIFFIGISLMDVLYQCSIHRDSSHITGVSSDLFPYSATFVLGHTNQICFRETNYEYALGCYLDQLSIIPRNTLANCGMSNATIPEL